jgi:hypothetical protein
MLLEVAGLFYIDSSVRMLAGLEALLTAVQRSYGLVTFIEEQNSIFSATHERMYDYLPMSRSSAVDVNMRAAGLLYVHRTEQVPISIYITPFCHTVHAYLSSLPLYCIV